jgi:hypothetical protein
VTGREASSPIGDIVVVGRDVEEGSRAARPAELDLMARLAG